MRILVHDFSGHPFQVQLSRELAARHHDVLHVSCVSFSTGKGNLVHRDEDPPWFQLAEIDLGEPFEKYSYGKRIRQERRYAADFIETAREFEPQLIVSANVPLFAQHAILKWTREQEISFVFWQQDIYSIAMRALARQKLPLVGDLIGRGFERMERRMLNESDAVVCISPDFLPVLEAWGVMDARVHVIENWAPLDEVPVLDRHNAWSAEQGLDDALVFLYAGTLGLKHNPDLLLQLARAFEPDGRVRVVVTSEGPGEQWLRVRKDEEHLDNLVLLPFQPFERVPEMLATADVEVSILQPDAGVFSVPSKVLTYLCAQRPILGAIPQENLAARIITRTGAGRVVDPADTKAFVEAGKSLLADEVGRRDMALAGRQYAEETFAISRIGDRFVDVTDGIAAIKPTRRLAPVGQVRPVTP